MVHYSPSWNVWSLDHCLQQCTCPHIRLGARHWCLHSPALVSRFLCGKSFLPLVVILMNTRHSLCFYCICFFINIERISKLLNKRSLAKQVEQNTIRLSSPTPLTWVLLQLKHLHRFIAAFYWGLYEPQLPTTIQPDDLTLSFFVSSLIMF